MRSRTAAILRHNGMKKTWLGKKDLVLIILALLAAAFLFLPQAGGNSSAVAVVELDGRDFARYDLSAQKETRVIDVGGSMNITLLLEPGAVSFLHSDCRDQICVRTGKLTKPGQAAVCLPGRVSVRIVGKGRTYDGYTG